MDTLVWKRKLGRLYPADKKLRRLVLLYHAVGDGPQALSKALFFKQMEWLKKYCKILSLTELLEKPTEDNRIQVAISFDDGYACLYREVAPILAELEMPAIVYLNTGWIGDDARNRQISQPDLGHYKGEYFLIWEEVLQLVRQQWEIGSHGVNHLDLTTEIDSNVRRELSQSKQTIESKLKKPCSHFAYTWGKHTKNLRNNVAWVQYQYAVAAHHSTLNKAYNNYALPRLNIEQRYTMEDFINIVHGKWDYLNAIQQLKRWL